MSLLTVVQNATVLLSLSRPSSAYGSSDATIRLLLQLLLVEGRDLLKAHDWNALITAKTFTFISGDPQTGEPPAAFDRMSRSGDGEYVVWNDTSNWGIVGPVSASNWVEYKTRSFSALPQYWRLIGGVLNVTNTVDGDSGRYEYISKNWILQGGSTPGSTFSADTDTFEFPENLLELGLVWRWKQAKGLDYAEDMSTYGRHKQDCIASDKGQARTINTASEKIDRSTRTWYGTITG
jgi:hypothetical protein